MGLEGDFEGLIDLIENEAVTFSGEKGIIVNRSQIPEKYETQTREARLELIEKLAEVDDEIAELFISEIDPTNVQLKEAVRRQTIARKFVAVFMGSAYKNKGT
jgi:elongation factor G